MTEMMNLKSLLIIPLLIVLTGFSAACEGQVRNPADMRVPESKLPANEYEGEIIRKTDSEWRKELSDMAYFILRERGTERAFSGSLNDNTEHGVYQCAACGYPVFHSDQKFDSGTGWPSFTEPFSGGHVKLVDDDSYNMLRTEVKCPRCDGHLGHVFEDGPKPAGIRYCINSAALDFVK